MCDSFSAHVKLWAEGFPSKIRKHEHRRLRGPEKTASSILQTLLNCYLDKSEAEIMTRTGKG